MTTATLIKGINAASNAPHAVPIEIWTDGECARIESNSYDTALIGFNVNSIIVPGDAGALAQALQQEAIAAHRSPRRRLQAWLRELRGSADIASMFVGMSAFGVVAFLCLTLFLWALHGTLDFIPVVTATLTTIIVATTTILIAMHMLDMLQYDRPGAQPIKIVRWISPAINVPQQYTGYIYRGLDATDRDRLLRLIDEPQSVQQAGIAQLYDEHYARKQQREQHTRQETARLLQQTKSRAAQVMGPREQTNP